jgi:FKBP-type peptidyl-prolyl cis-trans isomerase
VPKPTPSWEDLKVCSGPTIRHGDLAVLLYKAALSPEALSTGDWIESTYKPDVPIEIRFTPEDLLSGVYEGMADMRAGGSIRRITVPAELGYGEKGFGLVPSASSLHIDICLMRISRTD